MVAIAGMERTDEIDVIAVDLDGHPDWSVWSVVPGDAVATWTSERVSVVLDLVSSLPGSTARRCFLPHYAIRLRCGALVLTEVAFCFQCHNGVTFPIADSDQPRTWFTFDPDSKPAQDLLRLLQCCAD